MKPILCGVVALALTLTAASVADAAPRGGKGSSGGRGMSRGGSRGAHHNRGRHRYHGRNHKHWSHRYYDRRFGRYHYYDPFYRCYYYWSPGEQCYCPVQGEVGVGGPVGGSAAVNQVQSVNVQVGGLEGPPPLPSPPPGPIGPSQFQKIQAGR